MMTTVALQLRTVPTLTVTCSLDLETQMTNALGAARLFQQWGDEENLKPDMDAFLRELSAWMQNRTAWICVVWDGETPVGMTSFHLHYDAFQSRFRAWGERLYVTKSHRDMRVFRALWASGEVFTRLAGATEQVITSRSPVLGKWYERAGFVETDRIYKRNIYG